MSDKKSKKPLRPLAKHLLFGIPANIAAGPLGFRAELDVNPKGERTCSHRGLRAGRTDPTATSDEKNPDPSRIAFRERESDPQESPVPGTSTAVHIEQSNHPTSQCFEPTPSQPILTSLCPLGENISQIRQEDEPGAASMGTRQFYYAVHVLLTPASFEAGQQEHSPWGSYHTP